MGFLDNLFGSKGNKQVSNVESKKLEPVIQADGYKPKEDNYSKAGLTREITETEKEIVSAITSSILAGDNPDSRFKVKNVIGIDTEKEIVGIITTAIASGDNPNSRFRIVNVTEI